MKPHTYIHTSCSGTEGGGMERAAIQWEGNAAACVSLAGKVFYGKECEGSSTWIGFYQVMVHYSNWSNVAGSFLKS